MSDQSPATQLIDDLRTRAARLKAQPDMMPVLEGFQILAAQLDAIASNLAERDFPGPPDTPG